MKPSSLIALLTALAAGPTSVMADSCNRGGVYCGVSLLRKGNYHDHIVQTLKDAGQSTDDRHIQYSLFNCLSGGDIKYIMFCGNGCGGADSKDADYCL